MLTSLSTIHSQTMYTVSIPGLSTVGIPPSIGTQPYPNSNPITEPVFGRALPMTSFNSLKPDVQYPGSLFVSPFQPPYDGIPQVDDSYRDILMPKYHNPFSRDGGGSQYQNIYGDNTPDSQFGNYGTEHLTGALMKIRSRMLGLQRDVERLNRDIAHLNKAYEFN